MLCRSATCQSAQARQSAAKAGSVEIDLILQQREQPLERRVEVGVDAGEDGVKLRHGADFLSSGLMTPLSEGRQLGGSRRFLLTGR